MGCLDVVTFGNVDLSLFRGKPTRLTCRLWRLVVTNDCVEKLDYNMLWKNTSVREYSQAAKV